MNLKPEKPDNALIIKSYSYSIENIIEINTIN